MKCLTKNKYVLSFGCLIIIAACLFSFLPSSLQAQEPLRLGDQSEEVEELQKDLQKLGLYDGPITGLYGDQTRYAVEELQQIANLRSDGLFGSNTRAALDKISGDLESYPELTLYSHQAEVYYLQQLLVDLDYLEAQPSGLFRSLTYQAVQSFQEDQGLEADGVVDKSTWEALESKSSPSAGELSEREAEEITPEEEEERDREDETEPEEEEKIAEERIEEEPDESEEEDRLNPDELPILRQGDTGEEVKELQRLLQSHGFYPSSVDGSFGHQTSIAVKQFQNLAGLSVDSVVGPNTWQELLAEGSGEEIYYTIQPGDSLWALANRFNTTPDKIRSLNNLSGDNIRAGDRIRVPGEGIMTAEIKALEWSEVDPLIPEGKTFTITDLDTGLSFRARRLYGTNHADAEPVSRRDTEIKRQIYGGSWSWDRRAVVVHINNMLVAGSINGVPHGGQDISSNNYNGHFCLHFRGSRLHNNGTIDDEHQAEVERAANEEWPLITD